MHKYNSPSEDQCKGRSGSSYIPYFTGIDLIDTPHSCFTTLKVSLKNAMDRCIPIVTGIHSSERIIIIQGNLSTFEQKYINHGMKN